MQLIIVKEMGIEINTIDISFVIVPNNNPMYAVMISTVP